MPCLFLSTIYLWESCIWVFVKSFWKHKSYHVTPLPQTLWSFSITFTIKPLCWCTSAYLIWLLFHSCLTLLLLLPSACCWRSPELTKMFPHQQAIFWGWHYDAQLTRVTALGHRTQWVRSWYATLNLLLNVQRSSPTSDIQHSAKHASRSPHCVSLHGT